MSFYAILIIILALIYLISPIDFIPDFFGLPGRVDDLAALIFAIWYLRKLASKKPGFFKRPGSFDASTGQRDYSRGSQARTSAGQNEEGLDEEEKDPFNILGVKRGASFQDVSKAYRELLTKYHPDKVHHLGKEFQEIAERKTKRLNKAYQEIKEYYQR